MKIFGVEQGTTGTGIGLQDEPSRILSEEHVRQSVLRPPSQVRQVGSQEPQLPKLIKYWEEVQPVGTQLLGAGVATVYPARQLKHLFGDNSAQVLHVGSHGEHILGAVK